LSHDFRRFPLFSLAALAALACGQPTGPAGPGSDADPDPAPPAADAARSDRGAADRAAPASPDAGAPESPAPTADDDAGAPEAAPPDAAGPARVLLFTRATGYVHESKGAAAMAIQRALTAFAVEATISEDPVLIQRSRLDEFAAVVLIDTTGTPFGDPGTSAIDDLAAYVRGGRGLVGIHAASNGHETSPVYVGLIGGDFTEHPGGVRMGRCYPEGSHPSVARLPPSFGLVDEFYLFRMFRPDNVVDLRCDALGSAQKIPIAWHRAEGQGRVFFTALGHNADEWTDRRIVEDHVIPGILWTLGR
jgi:type 1 glutamine amidotransferase